MCVFRDRKVFFFDTDAGMYETACHCARAVYQTVGDLETIYLKPAVREFINETNESK